MEEEEMMHHDGREVKSLIRFETVSKHWRCTITSKFFREKYTLHQKTQEPKVICLYDDKSWYKRRNTALTTMKLEWSSSTCLVEEDEYHMNDDNVGVDISIPSASIDGLVCFYPKLDTSAKIRVINPATRWSYKVPLANIQIKCYYANYINEIKALHLPGFGNDYVTGTYKLPKSSKSTSSQIVISFSERNFLRSLVLVSESGSATLNLKFPHGDLATDILEKKT
ncbi:putative F-box protein [Cardamine amara subsp. amara]|uniref:F-box protein n=1 Tax=Cardamine amara subsp. amara TaxID=228776 RepID=A0ABD1BMT8_CARAN